MHVLGHQQHRLTRRQPLDLRHQRPQCLLLALLRGEVERGKAVVDRNRQQTRQQGHGLAEVIRRQGEHRLQSGQPLLVRVGAPKPGGPFELRDARVERRVLVMGRAEQTQARVRLAAHALEDGLGDPGLADAWLAGEQDDGALASLRLLPAAQEQIDLLAAPNERRRTRAQRLEPALGGARAQRLPRRDGLGAPFERDRPEIAVVNRLVYVILAEDRLVLPEAKAPQPTPEFHDGALNGLPAMIVRPSRRVQRSLRAAPPTTSWEVTPPRLLLEAMVRKG